MIRRHQKNITLSDSQKEFLLGNFPIKDLKTISKELKLNYGKVHNNARLLGLVKPLQIKEVKIDNGNGYFDEELFFKLYNY